MWVGFGFDFGFGFGGPLLSVNSTEVKSVPPLLSQWSIGVEMNILTIWGRKRMEGAIFGYFLSKLVIRSPLL